MTTGRPTEAGEIAVRPATADDLDELADLEAESFGEDAWSRRQLADGLDAAGAVWLVGSTAGPPPAIRAYAAFQRADDEAELLRVAVHPSMRRRGLGAVVVRAGFERLAEAGARACFLEVADDNAPALALYRRLGFEPAGRRRGYYGHGRDALLLRLGLTPDAGPG